MISIHIFARGKSPRTATTGANIKQGVLGGYKSVRLQRGVKHPVADKEIACGRGAARVTSHRRPYSTTAIISISTIASG